MTDKTVFASEPEAKAVAEIVRRHLEPRTLPIKAGDNAAADVLIVPNGLEVKSIKKLLDEYRTAPERRKGTAKLADLESFIAHVKRFADGDSVLFADPKPEAPYLLAVLDYHRIGCAGAPRFGEHRARYEFPLSDEWTKWTEKNDSGMSQTDFAQFVEDRIGDVADPAVAGDTAKKLIAPIGCDLASPSRLMDLSRGLSVRVGAKVVNAVSLATGEAQIRFETSHSDESGAPLKIPGAFLIAIPVFRNGALYQLAARLRYRVQSGSVTWQYSLYRVERVFDHALREACDTAETETGLPLYLGTPEA